MHRISRAIFAIVVLAAIGACSTTSTQEDVCTDAAVATASDARSIRAITANCLSNTEVYARANLKLNNLPPPLVRSISLSPVVPLSESERVRFEVDVFFNLLEAYPPDIAFEKLDDLLRKTDGTFKIESIRIVGAQDGFELGLPSFGLARKRADFLKKFFAAAALPGGVSVALAERGPKQPDTPEGRARDRVAEVTIVVLRRRTSVQ